MKKCNKNYLLALLLICGTIFSLQAQIVEGSSCTSTCINYNKATITGRMPKADGISKNVFSSCSTAGDNVEDNPAWWHFRAKGNSATFSIATSNCVAGTCGSTDVQMTLWEGETCADVTPKKCMVGSGGSITIDVSPCKLYFLQVDGVCESQCNITITYDKEEILGDRLLETKVEGEKQICKGYSKNYAAKITNLTTCISSEYKWGLSPASAGTITKINGATGEISLKIVNMPVGNKVKLYAEPIFKSLCQPKIHRDTIELSVVEDANSECASIDDKDVQSLENQVNIYPNPTQDKFFIEIPSVKNLGLDLYNTQGQIVLSQKNMIALGANQYEASVAHLPKGVYVLKMNLDGKAEVRKIVIN